MKDLTLNELVKAWADAIDAEARAQKTFMEAQDAKETASRAALASLNKNGYEGGNYSIDGKIYQVEITQNGGKLRTLSIVELKEQNVTPTVNFKGNSAEKNDVVGA